MNILQILKIYGMFGDVRKAVADDKGEAGWWYSRKFIGAVLVFGAAIVLYLTGITIDADTLNKLTGNITDMITAIVGIYGLILTLVSLFKKKATIPQNENTIPKE
jgi:uncharacterized membrane protein